MPSQLVTTVIPVSLHTATSVKYLTLQMEDVAQLGVLVPHTKVLTRLDRGVAPLVYVQRSLYFQDVLEVYLGEEEEVGIWIGSCQL